MRLPGYTQLTVLGEGGFGRVVLARHDATSHVVAIKYLTTTDERSRAQFRHEAAILRRVVSPHVARLHAFHETPAGAAIVMEAVPGVSLKDMLSRYGRLAPQAALAILKGSLLGLAAAHKAGTVHRDYKPGNVLVQPNNQSKLVDFGIALLSGHSGHTGGTPAYMAPEQWSGGPATPATDVYAATCVFFLCVTGTRPFPETETERLRQAHQHQPPPVGHAPPPVQALIARGMAKDLRQRPASATKFVKELEKAATAGYGKHWEVAGWHHLANFAGTLLAASPMAWVISATGVLTTSTAATLAAAGGTAVGSAAGTALGSTTAGAATGGLAAGTTAAGAGGAATIGTAGAVGSTAGAASGLAGGSAASTAGGAAIGGAASATGGAAGTAAGGLAAGGPTAAAAAGSGAAATGTAASGTAVGGGAAASGAAAGSAAAGAGVSGAAAGSAAVGGAVAGVGGGAAGGTAGVGGVASGAAAGGAAKGAAGALAAKIAAAVVGVAVVVSGTVIVVNTVGDPPGVEQAAVAVGTRAEVAERDVNISLSTEIVYVSGGPRAEALSAALRAPVDARVESLVGQVNGIRDMMRDGSDSRWDDPVTIKVTANVLLQNENYVSVRYDNEPALGSLSDSSWLSNDTVTVDLRTGRALSRDDIYRDGAARALADVLLADHASELCPATSGGDRGLDLTEDSLGKHVAVAFAREHAEFTIDLQYFDRPTACGMPTFEVPYERLRGVLNPDLLRGVADG